MDLRVIRFRKLSLVTVDESCQLIFPAVIGTGNEGDRRFDDH